MAMEAIQIKAFGFQYAGSENAALSDIRLTILSGEIFLLTGYTGSGKSTLLRSLKREVAPAGHQTGSIHILGQLISEECDPIYSAQVGLVLQDPNNQIVMDSVWHELAFGLENLGLPSSMIRRRVAETASFFGIEDWFHQETHTLSGGQKQVLSLAATMAMQPTILLLDEPTAQLDPIAAKDFLQWVFRINQEIGTTILFSEHRLEESLPMADKVAFLDKGQQKYQGTPQDFVTWVSHHHSDYLPGLPAATYLAARTGAKENLPITVREGRAWLEYQVDQHFVFSNPEANPAFSGNSVIDLKGVWFRYKRETPFVLEQIELSIFQGEIHGIVGGNGSGKSTLAKLLAGIIKPVRGKIKSSTERIALLPQEVKAMFSCDTIFEELMEWHHHTGYNEVNVLHMTKKLGFEHVLDQHPYDVSGGEAQLAALAKLLLTSPDVLILDEPTKGLDALIKEKMKNLLLALKAEEKTIILITHDLDFAAEVTDRCSMIFDHNIIVTEASRGFFGGNAHYTTAIGRMTKGILSNTVSIKDVMWHE